MCVSVCWVLDKHNRAPYIPMTTTTRPSARNRAWTRLSDAIDMHNARESKFEAARLALEDARASGDEESIYRAKEIYDTSFSHSRMTASLVLVARQTYEKIYNADTGSHQSADR